MSEQLALAELGIFVLCIVLSFCFIAIVAELATVRKSKKYRKFLTDMYVSAKIKLLAKDDDLDIEKEELSFNNWNKKNKHKNESFGLDDAVEDELIEKIEDPVKPNKKE